MNWDWLFGTKEEEYPTENSCSADPVVFEGTTADLLASLPPPEGMAEPVVEPVVEEVKKEEETMEEEKNSTEQQTWMNVELLKMALEIEASKRQKMVFYVDIGMLPKTKIEPYLKELQKTYKDKDGDFWLPRKEGGRGTEIEMTPGRVTVEAVLETAQRLKDFVSAK
jgi:hypothetical protein